MSDERSGVPGEERPTSEDESPGVEPGDRDPAAGGIWIGDCGWDCACLGDRGSRSERAGRAAQGEVEPESGFSADGSVEATTPDRAE